MFSKEEILARLRRGDEAADIAQEMADTINAALDEYNEEKSAAAASRSKARTAVDALCDYFMDIFHDEVSDKEREGLTDVLVEMASPVKTDDDVIKAFLKALS